MTMPTRSIGLAALSFGIFLLGWAFWERRKRRKSSLALPALPKPLAAVRFDSSANSDCAVSEAREGSLAVKEMGSPENICDLSVGAAATQAPEAVVLSPQQAELRAKVLCAGMRSNDNPAEVATTAIAEAHDDGEIIVSRFTEQYSSAGSRTIVLPADGGSLPLLSVRESGHVLTDNSFGIITAQASSLDSSFASYDIVNSLSDWSVVEVPPVPAADESACADSVIESCVHIPSGHDKQQHVLTPAIAVEVIMGNMAAADLFLQKDVTGSDTVASNQHLDRYSSSVKTTAVGSTESTATDIVLSATSVLPVAIHSVAFSEIGPLETANASAVAAEAVPDLHGRDCNGLACNSAQRESDEQGALESSYEATEGAGVFTTAAAARDVRCSSEAQPSQSGTAVIGGSTAAVAGVAHPFCDARADEVNGSYVAASARAASTEACVDRPNVPEPPSGSDPNLRSNADALINNGCDRQDHAAAISFAANTAATEEHLTANEQKPSSESCLPVFEAERDNPTNVCGDFAEHDSDIVIPDHAIRLETCILACDNPNPQHSDQSVGSEAEVLGTGAANIIPEETYHADHTVAHSSNSCESDRLLTFIHAVPVDVGDVIREDGADGKAHVDRIDCRSSSALSLVHQQEQERNGQRHNDCSNILLEHQVAGPGSQEGSCDSTEASRADGAAELDTDQAAARANLRANQTVFSFYLPTAMCGLFIGKKGRNVNHLKAKSGAFIHVEAVPTSRDMHLCIVKGSEEAIGKAIEAIVERFPQLSQLLDVDRLAPEAHMPAFSAVDVSRLHLQLVPHTPVTALLAAVVNATSIFVQLPTHPTFPSLERLSATLVEVYTGGTAEAQPHLLKPITPGTLCAAESQGVWYRAMIIQAYEENNEDKASVQLKYLDFGGYDTVPLVCVRQLRSDFLSLPFQAVECSLAHVKPPDDADNPAEANAVSCLLEFSGGLLECITIGTNDAGLPRVDLYANSNGRTMYVNQLVSQAGHLEWVD